MFISGTDCVNLYFHEHTNFVFPYNFSFLHYLDLDMLVNVTLDLCQMVKR